ncbi:MAG: preprotein translocase subunit SecG [Nitrospinota bacterium]
MVTGLTILHILVSLTLILIVLLQVGKGSSLGAAFGGGSSQTVFGGRGPASFLSKVTTVAAIIFMLTSLGLAWFSATRGTKIVVPKENPRSEAPLKPGGGRSP